MLRENLNDPKRMRLMNTRIKQNLWLKKGFIQIYALRNLYGYNSNVISQKGISAYKYSIQSTIPLSSSLTSGSNMLDD